LRAAKFAPNPSEIERRTSLKDPGVDGTHCEEDKKLPGHT
jgi:hypothetical protein